MVLRVGFDGVHVREEHFETRSGTDRVVSGMGDITKG